MPLTSWETKALDRIETASGYLKLAKKRVEGAPTGAGRNLEVARELLFKATKEIVEAAKLLSDAEAEGF
jgi:hypothetical protein